MKTKILSFAVCMFTAGALIFSSCQKGQIEKGVDSVAPNGQKVTINGETSAGCVPIYAGQTINVGSLCLDDIDTNNDGVDDALQVCATTTGCWEITGVASWVGCGTCMPPMNKGGNPVPGQFPYQSGTIATQSYCFTIPFGTLGITSQCPSTTWEAALRGAIHLNVHNTCTGATETGWAAGDRINTKGNWGTYFGFNIKCDENENPCSATETAWGRSDQGMSICFNDLPCINAGSWGWTNGGYDDNLTHTLRLLAGAPNECNGNGSTGTDVGGVSFYRSGSTLYVNVTATSSVHPTEIVHFYAGSAQVSQNGSTGGNPNDPCSGNPSTIAPGQLGYNSGQLSGGDKASHSFTVTVPATGPYYVMCHIESGLWPCPVQ